MRGRTMPRSANDASVSAVAVELCRALRADDLDAEARQQPVCRGIDAGIEHRLGATRQDRHPPAAFR